MRTYIISGEGLVAQALIPSAVIYIAFLLILVITKNRNTLCEHLLYVREFTLLVYVWSVGFITGIFVPGNWSFEPILSFNYVPFTNESLEMILLNVLMMIPMGILLPMVFIRMNSWKKMLWAAVLIPMLIEIVQMLFVGRCADIDDIMTNFVGCMVGYGMFNMLSLFFRNKQGKPVGMGTTSLAFDFFALCWGTMVNRLCMGDMAFIYLGIQSWTGNENGVFSMNGIHYSEIVTFLLLGLAMILSRKHYEDYLAKPGMIVSIAIGVYTAVMMVVCFK
jgi:Glycopeptide antibiotics resistance protein